MTYGKSFQVGDPWENLLKNKFDYDAFREAVGSCVLMKRTENDVKTLHSVSPLLSPNVFSFSSI
jgi:hypothetical protein